jgi:hypothetical protein
MRQEYLVSSSGLLMNEMDGSMRYDNRRLTHVLYQMYKRMYLCKVRVQYITACDERILTSCPSQSSKPSYT